MEGGFERTLAAGRLWAVSRFPYLAAGLFALAPVPAPGVGTMAADRRGRLYLDPAALDGLDAAATGGLLLHHLGHVLRDHAGRAYGAGVDEPEAAAWVAAADAEINDDLAAAGVPLPPGAILPATLGQPDGLLAEEYLAAARTAAGRAEDHGSAAHGRPRRWETPARPPDPPPLTEREIELVRLQVAAAVGEAVRGTGDVPGGWRRWAETYLGPAVDWRRLLGAELRAALANRSGMVDFTHRRRSRRAAVTPGVVLPGLHRPLPEVAAVVDTSASITPSELGRAQAEVEAIVRQVGVRRLRVVATDAAVHGIHTARSRSTEGRPPLAGGGGTDLAVGLAAAADLRPRPDVVVVLTDGYTSWPPAPPPGTRVVIGLLGGPGFRPPVPSWARAVEMEGPRQAS